MLKSIINYFDKFDENYEHTNKNIVQLDVKLPVVHRHFEYAIPTKWILPDDDLEFFDTWLDIIVSTNDLMTAISKYCYQKNIHDMTSKIILYCYDDYPKHDQNDFVVLCMVALMIAVKWHVDWCYRHIIPHDWNRLYKQVDGSDTSFNINLRKKLLAAELLVCDMCNWEFMKFG
jgi:hypothetical protein